MEIREFEKLIIEKLKDVIDLIINDNPELAILLPENKYASFSENSNVAFSENSDI